MSKFEIEGTQPPERVWSPARVIRPHHLFYPELIAALKGERSRLAYSFVTGTNAVARIIKSDASGNLDDVYGKGLGDFLSYRRSEREAYEDLEKLKDDDVIELSPKSDMLCRACIVGKHCTATNYQYADRVVDTLSKEQESIEKAEMLVAGAGYEEGRDFVFEERQIRLLDYGGRKLSEGNPEVLSAVFKAMLVKTGVLREIL